MLYDEFGDLPTGGVYSRSATTGGQIRGGGGPQTWAELMAYAPPRVDQEMIPSAPQNVTRDVPGLGKVQFTIHGQTGEYNSAVVNDPTAKDGYYVLAPQADGSIGKNNTHKSPGIMSGGWLKQMGQTLWPVAIAAGVGGLQSAGMLGGAGAAGATPALGGGLADIGATAAGGSSVGAATGLTPALAPTVEGMAGFSAPVQYGGVGSAGVSAGAAGGMAGMLEKLTGIVPGGIPGDTGLASTIGKTLGGTTAAGGGSSIWDDIGKAFGITTTAAGVSNWKDIIGGLAGAYGADKAGSQYADTMKDVAQQYSDAMKYAVDKSDPFSEQRGQYQTQLSDVMSGRSNPSNNSLMMDQSTNNPYYMSTSTENNPWLQNTDVNELLNSPLMQGLTNTSIDNTMRRLTSKYGGDASSLGVVNEVAGQVNAANAPLAMDYYKSNLANNQNYLNTAAGNNQSYLKTATANNLGYLGTLGQAAGANIQPQAGQIAAAGAQGLAGLYGNAATAAANNSNNIYGNLGVAGNGLLNMLFSA